MRSSLQESARDLIRGNDALDDLAYFTIENDFKSFLLIVYIQNNIIKALKSTLNARQPGRENFAECSGQA